MKSCRSDKVSDKEKWKDIPGYGGTYQASTEGRIRKVWPKSGKTTIMRGYQRTRGNNSQRMAMRVHLTKPDGKRVERTVIGLISETFFCAAAGKIAIHSNGLKSDNSVHNIEFVTKKELGQRFGKNSKRKPVVKIDRHGEIIACYTSAREAARNNFVSYQTVIDRCNGVVKKEFALDGCTYRWDDDKRYSF